MVNEQSSSPAGEPSEAKNASPDGSEGWHKYMPYPGAFEAILKAKAACRDEVVPPEVVLALIQRESFCNPFFCKCDKLYKQNLTALSAGANIRMDLFVNRITVEHPPGVKAIPKFRFEPTWWALVCTNPRYKDMPQLEKVVWSCSFGIAQKWSLALVERQPESMWDDYLKRFCMDPQMQLIQCIHDLRGCYASTEGDWQLALSRYNAGRREQRTTGYGAQVWSVAEAFRKVAEGLQGRNG